MIISRRSRAYYRALSSLAFVTYLCFGAVTQSESQIHFEEVTDAAEVSFSGGSWGASWGDFNGDGKPDIWVSDCAKPTRLKLNNGDGTFMDASDLFAGAAADTHGAAWADFDNDGDQDLIQMVGGGGANQLFINTGYFLEDRAVEYGLTYALGRGRTPMWFDWNRDGYLDVFLANLKRSDDRAPSALFTQLQNTFVNDNDSVGITTDRLNLYAQLAHLTAEHTPILLIHTRNYPDRAYDFGSLPFTEVSENLGFPNVTAVQDSAIVDVDGDLDNDIYLARSTETSTAVLVDSTTLHAFITAQGIERGIRFRAPGDVHMNIPKKFLNITDIYVGQDGHHPDDFAFTLSPETAVGLFPHSPGSDVGVYIGYNPAVTRWQVFVSGLPQTNLMLESATAITDLETIGFTSSDGALQDHLLVFESGTFQDVTAQSGLDFPTACGSVVAADFDNDMDIDFYLVCRSAAANLPNRIYENLGDGTFEMVLEGGGAEGSTIGRGDSVALADYDEDGFVDLFVTNGLGAPPFDNGPDQLFRNLGNANNWLEIDLEGVRSNRDAIGARLVARASGVSQFREQVGGMHAASQNHQRVHFGLAGNERVDRLTVEWPSGVRQEIKRIPANQIIRIVEPSSPSLLGNPGYIPGTDAGVYLWKETFDGPYYLRTSGDGSRSVFTVEVIADRAFDAVVPYRLEPNDVLHWQGNYFLLSSKISSGHDGVEFTLPPGSQALIKVEQNGRPNPRQLHIGAASMPLAPRGWILKAADLPDAPPFDVDTDLGLFMGKGATPVNLVNRWSGDRFSHRVALSLFVSEPILELNPVSIESHDSLTSTEFSVSVRGWVGAGYDGVDVTVNDPQVAVGFSYLQDGLFQSHRVNPHTREFGIPNAYELPVPDYGGTPDYDPSIDRGLFLWREPDGLWHLRATAGGIQTRYTGVLNASVPASQVTPIALEAHDVLDKSIPGRIYFDLSMGSSGQDGLDFHFPTGTEFYLELNANDQQAAELIRVGGEAWPIDELPLILYNNFPG